MKIRQNKAIEYLVWALTVLLFSTFYIFESYTWGKYIFLLVTAAVFVLTAARYGGKYRYEIGPFQYYLLPFIAFSFVSSIWAISASDAIQKGITLTETLVCMSVIYNYYVHYQSARPLLDAVKWSSYVISMYSIYFYGVNFIRLMVQMGVRLDNSYTNINSIGMLAAIGILIQFDELLGDKQWSIPVLFCVPSIYMIAATQSRKALVMLVVGVFMILILRNIDNKDALETILRVTAICVLFCAAFYVAMMLPVFAGVAQRMKGLIAMVTGKGEMGASASIRKQMVQIGMEQFRKTPLVGIGIGCPHYISAKKLSFDAYLHNNYVELLAAGGVIGFVLYYGIYVYLIGNLWAIKIRKSGDYIIVCTLIIVFLIKDYGMVSMYSKSTYFYFVIFFLAVRKMRKRKNLMNRRRKYIR